MRKCAARFGVGGCYHRVKETAEREGRNPSTGETMTIAPGKKMSFAPAKGVKEKLNA